MMDGMTFGMEGPNLNGTWFNPKTNQYITVRDTMFEDNNLIVLTTDGRHLDYRLFQNFVRVDKMPNEKETPKIQVDPPVNENSGNDLPPEVASILDDTPDDPYKDLMLPEDSVGGNLYEPVPAQTTKINTNPNPIIKEDPNILILNKILGDKKLPTIEINIRKDDLPAEVISVAKDMLGVTTQEIINWYISKLDMNTLMESLQSSIESAINNIDEPESDKNEQVQELSIIPAIVARPEPVSIIENPKPKRTTPKTPSRKGVKKTAK